METSPVAPVPPATQASSQAASDAGLSAAMSGSTPAKAKPASYAAAAASPGPNPASPPRVSGSSPGGPKPLRAQSRNGSQNQLNRAASRTPPRRRSSDRSGDKSGGAGGAQTHRGGQMHPMHRISDIGAAAAPSGPAPSAISINRTVSAGRLQSMQRISDIGAANAPVAASGPVPAASAIPASRAASSARQPSRDVPFGGESSVVAAAASSSSNITESTNITVSSRVPKVPQLNMASVAPFQPPAAKMQGTRGLLSGSEDHSDRSGSGGSGRSLSSSSSNPSSDEARARPPRASILPEPRQVSQTSKIPRLRLDMSQLQRGNPTGPIGVPVRAGGPAQGIPPLALGTKGGSLESQTLAQTLRPGANARPGDALPQARVGALTSRLHRISSSGSQDTEESDGRPLTARTERSRNMNPFTCLMRLAGAANVKKSAARAPPPGMFLIDLTPAGHVHMLQGLSGGSQPHSATSHSKILQTYAACKRSPSPLHRQEGLA